MPVTGWGRLISGWDWYLGGFGDSPFFDGGDERTVIFPEGFFEGSYQLSEVNYIQIGMNGAASGMDVDQTKKPAKWWKASQYRDPLSAGTEKWLRMGHMYYSTYAAVVGPTLPSARGVSLHAWYKKVP